MAPWLRPERRTCKMGQRARAVVDSELRAYDCAGLRAIDASIMPTTVRGNTHQPTVMIAERAADLLLG